MLLHCVPTKVNTRGLLRHCQTGISFYKFFSRRVVTEKVSNENVLSVAGVPHWGSLQRSPKPLCLRDGASWPLPGINGVTSVWGTETWKSFFLPCPTSASELFGGHRVMMQGLCIGRLFIRLSVPSIDSSFAAAHAPAADIDRRPDAGAGVQQQAGGVMFVMRGRRIDAVSFVSVA